MKLEMQSAILRFIDVTFTSWAILLIVGCGNSDLTETNTVEDETLAVWFSEEAAIRGLAFQHESGFDGRQPYLPEITGSGAALLDVDGDGDLDAYIVQSGSLHDDVEKVGNALYLNDGFGRFVEVPGAGGAGDTGYGMGVSAGDIDNDGDIDLYVTNVGPNVLFANDGSGKFTDITEQSGVGDPGWSTGSAFLDIDNDDDLDLVVLNYISWSMATELKCYVGNALTYCPPANYNAPAIDRLFRNNGTGQFDDITEQSRFDTSFGNGFGIVGADFNVDGYVDMFIANDMMSDQLWINDGNAGFDDNAMLWGSALGEHGIANAGMGVAAGDIDDDSDIDVMVVNLEGQTDSFFRNERSYFRDATAEIGLGLSGRYTRFGVVLTDFDNDGQLDLYEANGKVSAPSPTAGNIFDEPNVLLRGTNSGQFKEIRPIGGVGSQLEHTSRGLAVGDVDGDGGMDILVVNRDGPAYLLINNLASRGNAARFKALTAADGRDAYGTMISGRVGEKRLYRRIQPDGSYLSYSEPIAHFGLGTHKRIVDVQVLWPGSSQVEAFGDFEEGQVISLVRGSGRIN